MPIAGFEWSGYLGYTAVKFLGYSVFCSELLRANRNVSAVTCQLDADHHIENDWPCRACRYNLKKLSADSKCPECGTPICINAPSPPDRSFLLHVLGLGLFRTLVGVCFGWAYWWLVSKTFFDRGEALFWIPGLIPLRIIEWWLLIWLFFDRKLTRRSLGWRWAWYGVLCSFGLDIPAALGFCATGGIAVC